MPRLFEELRSDALVELGARSLNSHARFSGKYPDFREFHSLRPIETSDRIEDDAIDTLAKVAESADALDSKSSVLHRTCGFDSHLWYCNRNRFLFTTK